MNYSTTFAYRNKRLEVRVDESGVLQLYLDDCLRKWREPGPSEPQYVWTNVELEWEEHHYIEVRYWASTGKLRVAVNRELLLEKTFANSPAS